MITDNLASLFDPGQSGVFFRQGTVLAWNAATGANAIDVAGGTLTDVSILNTGEAIALKTGHVVGLLGQGGAWFIIGRITPPNDPNFAGASVAFDSTENTAQNWAIDTTMATKVSATLDVPAWADEAAIVAVGTGTATNTLTVPGQVVAQAFVNGVPGSGIGIGLQANTVSFGNFGALAVTKSLVITNPAATITVEMKVQANGNFPASSLNIATISATAFFRSTV